MGSPGGGSKISWDGLEYGDIAAFTQPMQKKDVRSVDGDDNVSVILVFGVEYVERSEQQSDVCTLSIMSVLAVLYQT